MNSNRYMRWMLAALMMGSGLASQAQAADEGQEWRVEQGRDGIPRLVTPGIDREAAEEQDAEAWVTGGPLRYAIPLAHEVTPESLGTWERIDARTLRWRLRIASPEAKSINLGFTRFHLPHGASLRLLDANGTAPFRAFTHEDNDDHGQLWTPLVFGSEIIVELTVPAVLKKEAVLLLGSINHGYRNPGERPDFARSGSCNVDVVCPEGDGWRDQIRSSAVISTGGSTFCSGALINNTAQDMKPYFLTAYHCQITAANAASLVTYWNFENSTCRVPGSGASGGAGDGQLTQFNTGAIFRAARSQSDFTLVELDDPVNPDYNPYWSGWSRATTAPPWAVGIHHPNTDEKRISFENDATSITTYLQNATPGDGTHIRITDWDLGTTEPGSSGSPLYDHNKRIIGQLHGGYAACGNNESDWYGWLAASWTGGGTPATRLSDWLDPGNTGLEAIDGRAASPFRLAVDPPDAQHCLLDGDTLDFNVAVTADDPGFTSPVTLSAINLPDGLVAAFASNPVSPPGSTDLEISGLSGLAPGSHGFAVLGENGGESSSASVSLSISAALPGATTLLSPADAAGEVSVPATLTWEAVSGAQGYLVEVDDDPAFGSPEYSATVTATSTSIATLAPQTTYYWRVTAQNGCGSAASAVHSFTTELTYCFNGPAAIPDNNAAGVDTQVVIPAHLNGIVTDLDVRLDIDHTYVGDLILTLSKTGGPSVTLLNRPSSCSGNDIHLVADDEGTNGSLQTCNGTGGQAYVANGRYTPNQPLSAYDESEYEGTWTLNVADRAGQDTGQVVRWCLEPTLTPANLPPVAGTVPNQMIVVDENAAIDVSGYFSDPEGDALTFSISGVPALPASIVIDPETGIISGIPALSDTGVYLVTVTATDSPARSSVQATFRLTITGLFSDEFED